MKIVFDTNTLISGAGWDSGIARSLYLKWLAGGFELITSEKILAEVQEVFGREKFNAIAQSKKDDLLLLLRSLATVVSSEVAIKACKDPKDDMFIEAAVAGKARYIISADTHLLTMKRFKKILIVSPKGFKEILEEMP